MHGAHKHCKDKQPTTSPQHPPAPTLPSRPTPDTAGLEAARTSLRPLMARTARMLEAQSKDMPLVAPGQTDADGRGVMGGTGEWV